ncbi:alpha-L-rhamnosidase C-terminal domain-containing protein [uncultured Draconibacterium sp.]|uniref:alpha-L-rhamnosidase-related protein n=1 Tax=uncultured Draconibacterium sp. TaxID=1573823 RepID=UPI0032608ED8
MNQKLIKKEVLVFLFLCSVLPIVVNAQRIDERARDYLTPQKVIWTYNPTGGEIRNVEALLNKGIGQATLVANNVCQLNNGANEHASILLDFGKELHGGLEIVTGRWTGPREREVRVRFGESVSEAMADIDTFVNATNDHAIRDQKILLPWLGKKEIGNTGFRFVRIDLLGENSTIQLKEVNAISVYRDIPYLGSFECNDEMLNQIWETGAYTVHLNMQNFLWDGIKRDRLVWVGDMHPEVKTINSVFGFNEVVPKSLDMIRNNTPLPRWMNGISSYSMWWVLIHYEWYQNHGNLDYLKEQKEYMSALLKHFCSMVDENGQEQLNGNRFLDWPSSPYPEAVDAGYQALLKKTLEAGSEMLGIVGDKNTAKRCAETANRMAKVNPDPVDSKQAASLLNLADLLSNEKAADIILKDGAHKFSTFYGYYMLESLAKAGKIAEAQQIIKDYWGGMLELGATSFWEDFNMEWTENAGRIDELPQAGKIDIHSTYGEYCYVKLRHSFCHGWASGPTPWLTENVLGVKVLEPGCKKVKIEPNLGTLKWVKGTYPTPYGLIKIEHKLGIKGKIVSKIEAPEGVEIVK